MNNNHYNSNLKKFAHQLRTETVSRAERYIWKALLSKGQQGVKFKRERPIKYYIVDFFAQEIGMIIEIDGSSHFSKGNYDRKRQDDLEALGYVFMRFSEGEVIQDIGGVGERIQHAIHVLKNRE